VNVSFNLSNEALVNVTVTDLAGKVVYTSKGENNVAGAHSIKINSSNFSDGVYMVNFKANNEVSTQKIVIRK
jgi:flagellar hook assembly protein FlgD